ncbi:hypothetical protein GF312_16280 [Candidatus Poribacteria bacterium]|nr:hypothetical protein [Candidatus Poribacteria bacterium]
MKTTKSILLLLACIGLLSACNLEDMPSSDDSLALGSTFNWEAVLPTLDLASGMILVEKGGSIQESIDMASPGDIIYVEPGIYHETLQSDKKDIRIVGIPGENNEIAVLANPGESILKIQPLEKSPMKSGRCYLKMNREDLGEGIAHYEFEVNMGTKPYDILRIHRLVREYRPYRPVRTKGNVFMVHGGVQDFEDIFLRYGAENINAETSASFYLSSNEIDVWGIDLAWNMVPLETTDFEFMEDWGMEKDIQHSLRAMLIARLIRGLTGQGFGKMNLLGFSNGVMVAYGAAGLETQEHRILRHIKGIIPVDNHFKTTPGSELDQINCAQAAAVMEQLNAGMYQANMALVFIQFGSLALGAPDEASEAFPGLTNMQALMAIGATHNGGFHFHGGTPFEYYYTDSMRLARVAVELGPYMPNKLLYESYACPCSSLEVAFDDLLEEIRIPVLFITAEGETPNEDYTSTLTKSKDITRLNVEDPARPKEFDIGHGDIWAADNAAEWFWEPLRQWLLDH